MIPSGCDGPVLAMVIVGVMGVPGATGVTGCDVQGCRRLGRYLEERVSSVERLAASSYFFSSCNIASNTAYGTTSTSCSGAEEHPTMSPR
jgi:hypothetical protein